MQHACVGLDVGRLAVTEPMLGVASATYRQAVDYIPSTQIFGWVLNALTISEVRRQLWRSSEAERSVTANTLELLDVACKASNAIKRAGPGLPVSPELSDYVIAEFQDSLNDYGASTLSAALKRATSNSYPYVLGLVSIPKLSPVCARLRSEGITHAPLALLPLLNYVEVLLKDNKQLLERLLQLSKLANAMRVYSAGIAVDRLRKCAAYGMLYVYQYLYKPRSFISYVTLSKGDIRELTEILAKLPLGFKKSLSLTSISKVCVNIMRSDPDSELLELSLTALNDILLEHGRAYILAYAYGDTLYPALISMLKCGARLTRSWINCKLRGDIYLALTNSFYRLNLNNHDSGIGSFTSVAGRGSYAEYVLREDSLSTNVKNCLRSSLNINDPLRNCRPVKIKSHEGLSDGATLSREVRGVERDLVIRKAASTLRSLVFIPTWGESI